MRKPGKRLIAAIAGSLLAVGAGLVLLASYRPWVSHRDIGQDCTATRNCPIGLACMPCGSIAGFLGTYTCEMPCAPYSLMRCPPGLGCAVTHDGPGDGQFTCQEDMSEEHIRQELEEHGIHLD